MTQRHDRVLCLPGAGKPDTIFWQSTAWSFRPAR
jgi:hypothetical protein